MALKKKRKRENKRKKHSFLPIPCLFLACAPSSAPLGSNSEAQLLPPVQLLDSNPMASPALSLDLAGYGVDFHPRLYKTRRSQPAFSFSSTCRRRGSPSFGSCGRVWSRRAAHVHPPLLLTPFMIPC